MIDIRYYMMTISYIGKHYNGFQTQLDKKSIQDELERALSIYFHQQVKIRGASRTDSGVHAENQVVCFCLTGISYKPEKWQYSLNALLPRDIRINMIEPAEKSFDPIRQAVAKAYRYRLWIGGFPSPFVSPYVWSVSKSINLQKIIEMIACFEGVHDFSGFCNSDSDVLTKKREIIETKVDIKLPLVDIWFLGRGFLKQMVRIMVGTLVDISLERNEYTVTDLLSLKDRKLSGQTAPPQGLSLINVFYQRIPTIEELIEESQSGFNISLK